VGGSRNNELMSEAEAAAPLIQEPLTVRAEQPCKLAGLMRAGQQIRDVSDAEPW
jgi:hypothetical protein